MTPRTESCDERRVCQLDAGHSGGHSWEAAAPATEALRAAVHGTECGYASHEPDSEGNDPNPCGLKAERLAAALASPEPTPATTWSGKASNVEELRVSEEWPTSRESSNG